MILKTDELEHLIFVKGTLDGIDFPYLGIGRSLISSEELIVSNDIHFLSNKEMSQVRYKNINFFHIKAIPKKLKLLGF